MEFFSERELGKKDPNKTEIDFRVWNGIVVIYEAFVSDNCFSRDFPERCPDGNGICGCSKELLEDKLRSLISTLTLPVSRKEEFTSVREDDGEWSYKTRQVVTEINTYDTLDLIEFLYSHISDPRPAGQYHDYFNHYHYTFSDTGEKKAKFRVEINQIFQRNGLAYVLDKDGKIERIIPEELNTLLKRDFKTKDLKLNELLSQAKGLFVSPKVDDRVKACEKLWDAFERLKTNYSADKKLSASQLITLVARGNTLFEKHLSSEFKELTEIGNKFQIRHFETDKIEITHPKHLDYLCFRMFSLIDMVIKELEN